MTLRPALARAGAAAAMAALVACGWLAVAAAGGDYPRLWLSAGPVLGLGTAALGWAWAEIDRNAALVSADPLVYAGACLQAAGLPLLAFGGHLRREARTRPALALDLLCAAPLAALMAAGALGWLLLVAPAQYFLFLLFGAPARIALGSRSRLFARMEGGRLAAEPVVTAQGAPEPRPPEGGWDASMRDRPFALASAFMAAGLALTEAAI